MSINFKTIVWGWHGGEPVQAFQVIRDMSSWKSLKDKIGSHGLGAYPSLPLINFHEDMVIGVFLSIIGIDWQEIKIVSIDEKGDCLLVGISSRDSPKFDFLKASKEIQSYHLVMAPLSAKRVMFCMR